MAENALVIAGAVAPERLTVKITRGLSDVDMTTVSECELHVTDQSGGPVRTWTTEVESQTATRLVVFHEYEEDDVPSATQLSIRAYLTVPGGTRRTAKFILKVERA
jgi:hypothetical protein